MTSSHALLFTDVVDSTRLVEQLGDARAAEVWAEHDRRARELLVRYGGREIDRTDGFFLLFDEVGEATRCALGYHEALAELGLRARAGVHVGQVNLRENAPEDVARGAKPLEVEGLAKPFAARIMALARGGQTLLSAAAEKALAGALPERAELESHGHYRLKGVERPVELFELGVRGVAPFAPPADAEKAYRVVRAGDLWRPLREVRHNLPAERDAFVGRSVELWSLAQRLDAGARLLSVLGSGGSGKTRFVRRYGWTWLGDWPGGVYFCDLSEAKSLEGILYAVASALEVPLGKDDPVVQLGHAIAGRGHCLIILDNFEQVVAHASATLGRWLDRAFDAAFLVTSRERLHVSGEELFPIEPLSLERDAIDLFVTRARAQRPDFALNDNNRSAVMEVVRLLDGLPLAIELAAARIQVLAPHQLVERLKDRFALLVGARGMAARQATLRAASDWSWDLLSTWEQAALAQCSVFEGGFTLDAAEAVLELSAWPEAPPALDVVQALVEKSLLRTWIRAEQGRYAIEEPYFGMYVSVHEYAQKKLRAAGTDAERVAHERHGRYFGAFGTSEAIEALYGVGCSGRRRSLAFDLDNIIAACRRAVERGDGGTAVVTYRAAWEVLDLQGPVTLGVALGRQILGIADIGVADRVNVSLTLARALRRGGWARQAQLLLEDVLELIRQSGDRALEAAARAGLGTALRTQGRVDEARSHLEAALTVQRGLANRRAEGEILSGLGSVAVYRGHIDQGLDYFARALAIQRGLGNRIDEGQVIAQIAVVHGETGRLSETQALFEQVLEISRELGDRVSEAEALTNLGCLNQDLGRLERARSFYEQSLAMHRELGNRAFEGYTLGDLGRLHMEQGRFADGRACLEQAIAITRENADRRIEGSELRSLGDLLRMQGQGGDARAAYAEAERVLREIGDKYYLALTLCGRADLEWREGETAAARQSLAEAKLLAADTRVTAELQLGRRVAALERALSGTDFAPTTSTRDPTQMPPSDDAARPQHER